MSRHRRRLRLDDYLQDDYDDDDYDQYDEEEVDQNDPANQYYYRENQSSQSFQQEQEQPFESDGIDQDLLDDMVVQFRSILNDNSLTTTQVDYAIKAADYDWETALATLRSQQTVEARQAEPSPIARLLSSDDNDNDTHSSTSISNNHSTSSSILPKLPPVSHSTLSASALKNPDYSSYVDDNGTVFTSDTLPKELNSISPFQFDQPSPDDIVKAKQTRVGLRNTPALRLPKPTAGRSPIVKNAENESQSQSDKQQPEPLQQQQQKKQQSKPLKLPKPARPSRPSTSLTSNSTSVNTVVKQRLKNIDLGSQIKSNTPSISVVIAGHVDAGKSTLVGQLLQQTRQQHPSSSRSATISSRKNNSAQNLAWDTDDDKVERERGVTIGIASRLIQRPGPPPRTISLIDAPGHRDFVPAMIVGAAQATAALLVVDASIGEFEAGFSENGQTREHSVVLKSFGISSLIIVVNKMDMVDFDKERYEHIRKAMIEFLRANGWKVNNNNKNSNKNGNPQQVSFIPVSGRDGINLSKGPPASHPLSNWYSGKCLVKKLDDIPLPTENVIRNAVKKPTRIIVTDFFRSSSLGGQAAITGRIITGSVAAKDRLTVMPGNFVATIKAISIANAENDKNSNSNGNVGRVINTGAVAVAGIDNVSVSLGLSDLPDATVVASGCILCDPEDLTKASVLLRTRILVIGSDTVLLRGTRGVIHIGAAAEEAHIDKFIEYVGGKKRGTSSASNKEPTKKKIPRRLVKGDTAIVDIKCSRSIAVEVTEKYKELGRFAFRQEGWTIAVGIVVEVLDSGGDQGQSTKNEQGEKT